jgi:hypothetical protein
MHSRRQRPAFSYASMTLAGMRPRSATLCPCWRAHSRIACFNVKENAHNNVFEDNTCSANVEYVEFTGSNVELRGHQTRIRE